MWRLRPAVNRYLNRVTLPMARKLPGFAVLTHRGRKTGRSYRTPINVFRRGDDYLFFLTYGSDVQWVKNVLASGSCSIETRGRVVQLVEPELITDPDLRPAPPLVRFIERRVAGVTQYLGMRAPSGMAGGDDLSGTVRLGRGLGTELLEGSPVAEAFRAIAGFPVVPGTLNVRLPGPLARDGRWRYVAAEAIAPDWHERTGQTGYHLVDVLVAGRYRALAFQADEPEGRGYPPDQIELLSDTHLRNALGLADGDRIELAIRA